MELMHLSLWLLLSFCKSINDLTQSWSYRVWATDTSAKKLLCTITISSISTNAHSYKSRINDGTYLSSNLDGSWDCALTLFTCNHSHPTNTTQPPGLEMSGGWTPSSCLQTLIFEWKSALNFYPWAKFQTFWQLTPPPPSSFRSIPTLTTTQPANSA